MERFDSFQTSFLIISRKIPYCQMVSHAVNRQVTKKIEKILSDCIKTYMDGLKILPLSKILKIRRKNTRMD